MTTALSRLWKTLMGAEQDEIELEMRDQIGPIVNKEEAKARLLDAQISFFDALRGVVEENESLKKRIEGEGDNAATHS